MKIQGNNWENSFKDIQFSQRRSKGHQFSVKHKIAKLYKMLKEEAKKHDKSKVNLTKQVSEINKQTDQWTYTKVK